MKGHSWRDIWASSRWLKELTISVSSTDAVEEPVTRFFYSCVPIMITENSAGKSQQSVMPSPWNKNESWPGRDTIAGHKEKGRDVLLFCAAHCFLPYLGSFNLTCCLIWCHNPHLYVRSIVYFIQKTICNKKIILWKKTNFMKILYIKKCPTLLLVA